jgi:hypothetical protein
VGVKKRERAGAYRSSQRVYLPGHPSRKPAP